MGLDRPIDNLFNGADQSRRSRAAMRLHLPQCLQTQFRFRNPFHRCSSFVRSKDRNRSCQKTAELPISEKILVERDFRDGRLQSNGRASRLTPRRL